MSSYLRYLTAALTVSTLRISAQDGRAKGPKIWASWVDRGLRRWLGLPEDDPDYQ
jgi:hypothetical protein